MNGFEFLSTCILLFVLCIGVETAPHASDPAYVKCTRECTVEKNNCSIECRLLEDINNKPEVMSCLVECKDEYIECDIECSCISRCSRDLRGCIEQCDSHPFQSAWDMSECKEDCHHEEEVCQDLC